MIKRDRATPSLGIGKHTYSTDYPELKAGQGIYTYKAELKNTYDPEHPNLYRLGGLVETHNEKGRPPSFAYMKVRTMGVDQVPTMLRKNEIVIPVEHAHKVAKFLKSKNINLPNMHKLPKQ